MTSQNYATQSYVNGQGFITASALTPYLLSSTAASTYQTISGMSAYLSKAGNLSGLSNTATARTNLGLGTMATQTASNYLTVSAAAAGYYPLTGNPSGFITASALTGYATESWVTAGFYPLTGNPSAFLTDAPSDGSQYARQDGAWSVVTGGGGGSYLPLAGGTMTGPIVFDGTSGQYISKGNFDTSRGGNYGISLVCSIGYEFNWQAGWLTTTNQGNTTPRPLYLDSLAGTTLRAWDSATNTGVEVAHTGITFSNSTVQSSAAFVPGSGNLDMTGYDVTNANFNSSAGQVSAQNVSLSSGGSITFGDSTVQTTAYTGGGGGGLPVVQIAASAINPSYISTGANFPPLTYPTHTDILNGSYVTSFSYSNDGVGNPALILSGLTSLYTANVSGNAAMTSAPDFSGLTALNTAYVYNNASMTSAPDFSGCTALYDAQVHDNASMTSAPSFSGLTALNTATVNSNAAMTSAPDFSGCTALNTAQVYGNTSMTSAPSFSGCAALYNANVSGPSSMTSAPDFSGLTSLNTANVYDNALMTSAPSFSGCTSLTTANVSGCAITNCTDILDQLDANGLSGGFCDISGGTNEAIDPAYGSLTSLQGKGWTIVFNSL